MKGRALIFAGLLSMVAFAQKPPAKWTPPRTADGHPDLQGLWTTATLTPLERPPELAGKATLTPEEADAYEQKMRRELNRDIPDSPAGAGVGSYNEVWFDRGTKVAGGRRTSLITDPPDGRVPAMTPAGQRRMDAQREYYRLHPADGPEDRPLPERCLVWPTVGPPMLPGPYNNNYQIFQTQDSVAILVEMIHDVRIIPLDGRPHLPSSIRQWLGDARGHWEGDTLAVETTNFTNKTSDISRGLQRPTFRGTDENLRLTERFTRVDADTLLYEFTIDDPTAYTRPWSGQVPMTNFTGPLYEYACHEGNYAMSGILGGARAEEKRAAAAAGKSPK